MHMKKKYSSIKLRLFSYPSVSTCVLGTHLLSIHNICFGNKKIKSVTHSYLGACLKEGIEF